MLRCLLQWCQTPLREWFIALGGRPSTYALHFTIENGHSLVALLQHQCRLTERRKSREMSSVVCQRGSSYCGIGCFNVRLQRVMFNPVQVDGLQGRLADSRPWYPGSRRPVRGGHGSTMIERLIIVGPGRRETFPPGRPIQEENRDQAKDEGREVSTNDGAGQLRGAKKSLVVATSSAS